ncbi:hypothetical protein N9R95_00745 [Flavobacteriaceae bacterium]|nr:hypothetical protein [Flavobacteriaceae bacterium]
MAISISKPAQWIPLPHSQCRHMESIKRTKLINVIYKTALDREVWP